MSKKMAVNKKYVVFRIKIIDNIILYRSSYLFERNGCVGFFLNEITDIHMFSTGKCPLIIIVDGKLWN